jgi:hypothetical protein
MNSTPETDECVKDNKHIKFLEEDHCSLNGKFTYTHPIVALCRRLERQWAKARETVESLTTTSFDLLASLKKARDERDRLAEALEYILGIGLTQKTRAKAEKALQTTQNNE